MISLLATREFIHSGCDKLVLFLLGARELCECLPVIASIAAVSFTTAAANNFAGCLQKCVLAIHDCTTVTTLLQEWL